MRNHFLEEIYHEIKEDNSIIPSTLPVLLQEAQSPEQEWLNKSVIRPLQTAIDNLNISRSHIPTFISRQEVREEVEKLQKIQNCMLDIWHNIQDIMGTTPQSETVISTNTNNNLSYSEIESKAKSLKGLLNPNLKGTNNGQVKFQTTENAKKFADYLKTTGIETNIQGGWVTFSKPVK